MSLFDTKFLDTVARQTQPLLDLSGRQFSGSSLKKLIPVIAMNQHITHIDLSDNDHIAGGIEELVGFLATNPQITHLRISNYSKVDSPRSFGFDEAQELAKALRTNTTLQSLDISGNNTYDRDRTGINDVLKAIAENPNSAITEINISSYRGTLNKSVFAQFLEARKSSLKSLSLKQNGEQVQNEIASFLETNITLESLDLSHTCVDGISHILYRINKNPALPLRELKLNHGYLSGNDMEGLTTLVGRSATLESLDLSEAIQTNGSRAGSGFPGLVKVLEAAVSNPQSTLKKLNISQNSIMQQNAGEVFDHLIKLAENSQLTHLNIAYTNIPIISLAKLLHAIATNQNSKLVDLNLSGNEMSKLCMRTYEDDSETNIVHNTVTELVSILRSTKTLKHLDLSNCQISDIQPIIDAMESNPDLHLDSLKLGRNYFSLNSLGPILKGTKVTHLDLSDAKYYSSSNFPFKELKDTQLVSLKLCDLKMRDGDVSDLCKVLKGNKSLKTVDLSRGNYEVTTYGAKALIKLLADADTSITSIDFPYTPCYGSDGEKHSAEYNSLARHISEWKQVIASSDVKVCTKEAADYIMMNVAWWGNGEIVRFMLTDLVNEGMNFTVSASRQVMERQGKPWDDKAPIHEVRKDLFSIYKDDDSMQKFLHGLVEKQTPEKQKEFPEWLQDLHAKYIEAHPREAIKHEKAVVGDHAGSELSDLDVKSLDTSAARSEYRDDALNASGNQSLFSSDFETLYVVG